MVHSMTAFARQTTAGDWGAATWELRSVNHRYLEVSLRLPEDLRLLETEVRTRLGKRLRRGKVDGSLRYQAPPLDETRVQVDAGLVRALLEAADSVRAMAPDCGTLDPLEILKWPGVLEREPPDPESVGAAVLGALDGAIEGLLETRAREGRQLADVLLERVAQAGTQLARLREDLPRIQREIQARMERRLADLDVSLDPGRMEQEVALILTKIDVAEELDRLETHFTETTRAIEAGGPTGRRLDFLLQEMNREANTLGSKAAHIESTDAAVNLKVLIEQMREQVQNLE